MLVVETPQLREHTCRARADHASGDGHRNRESRTHDHRGTYVSGVIQELYCDYNTVVKKDQICAKIDPRPYQTAVDQAKANLSVAKAQLEKDRANLTYMKVSFERAGRLVQTNAISQDAYNSAKSNFEQAQAQVNFDQATTLPRPRIIAKDSPRTAVGSAGKPWKRWKVVSFISVSPTARRSST